MELKKPTVTSWVCIRALPLCSLSITKQRATRQRDGLCLDDLLVSKIFGARFVTLLFLDVKENENAMCAIKNKQKARSQELLIDTLVLLQISCGLWQIT